MPYTIYCAGHDHFPAACYGVFDSDVLAERHASRHLRHRKKSIIQINEPLEPENMLSLTALKRAANFALTVLRNVKKAEKEGYYIKAIDDLEEALQDRPEPEALLFNFRVHRHQGDVVDLVATTPVDAVRMCGYPEEVARQYDRHNISVETRGEAA